MNNQIFTNTLQFGNDKYLITRRLYRELIAQTNLIGNYTECRRYVHEAMNKCYKEIQEVSEFTTKKVDIEIN